MKMRSRNPRLYPFYLSPPHPPHPERYLRVQPYSPWLLYLLPNIIAWPSSRKPQWKLWIRTKPAFLQENLYGDDGGRSCAPQVSKGTSHCMDAHFLHLCPPPLLTASIAQPPIPAIPSPHALLTRLIPIRWNRTRIHLNSHILSHPPPVYPMLTITTPDCGSK